MMNIIQTFIGTWFKPVQQFQRLREEGPDTSIKPAAIFILVMGVLSGVITAIVAQFGAPPAIAGEPIPKGMVWLSVLLVPAVSIIGSFIGSAIVWILATGLNGTSGQYKSVYRVLATLSAFSPISAAVTSIPKVGPWIAVLLNLWALILMVIGIITVLQTPVVRTAVILGIVFGILFAFGIAARILTERQNNLATPEFGDLNNAVDTTDGGGVDDEKLNQQLDDLANKAKEDAKQSAAPVAPAKK